MSPLRLQIKLQIFRFFVVFLPPKRLGGGDEILVFRISIHHVPYVLSKQLVDFHIWVVEGIRSMRSAVEFGKIAAGVVNVTVLGFIGSDGIDKIQNSSGFPQFPVGLCNRRCLLAFPGIQFGTSWGLLYSIDDSRIRVACFFLDVAYESMT